MNANQIREALKKLKTYDQVAEFFGNLGYDFAGDAPVSTIQWPESLKENKLRPKYMAQLGDFKVIYCDLPGSRMLRALQRPILDQLARSHDFFMVVFHNKDQNQEDWWDFVNVRVIDGDTSPRRLARRISIGPSERFSDRLHTASSRLEYIDINQRQNISLLDLQLLHNEAFDVEKVTKEFYNQYVAVFKTFAGDFARLNPEYTHIPQWADDQAQILLDRLMFLYFIQKKGWLNDEVGYVYSRFTNAQHVDQPEEVSYYQNVIQPLFLKLSRSEVAQDSDEAIPFLNGGLFQFDAQHIVMNLKVSNKSFKFAFDTLFEKYAFTVEEDMADDRAVAIDPEMLGKVFENLILGREQESDKRKATGSYYTPRTIVSFMCQQSLREYLVQSHREQPTTEDTSASDAEEYSEAIRQLVEQHHVSEIVEAAASAIREALLSVRVIDPAVGSGAFLVGMLQEILQLVRLLDEKTNYKSTTVPNYTYDLKRDIIGRCLYGVDLQAQAVQICELRFWLSLVVDYEPKDVNRPIKEWIRDIAPLPNLSYLVRQGNSLIEEVMGEMMAITFDDHRTKTRMYQIKPLINRMQEKKAVYYRATEPDEKRRLNREMLSLQSELVIHLLTIQKEDVDTQLPQMKDIFGETLSHKEQQERDVLTAKSIKLSDAVREANDIRNQADALKPAMSGYEVAIDNLRARLGTFLWRVDFGEVFGDQGGFDIAIANPPYIRQEKIKESKEHLRSLFQEVFTGTADLFVYFYAQALRLLRPNGVMAFITPNKFLRANYGKPLRQHLKETTSLRLLIDFGDLPIFEATTYPFIVMAVKHLPKAENMTRILTINEMATLGKLPEAIHTSNIMLQSKLSEDGWQLIDNNVQDLIAKLKSKGKNLRQYVNGRFYSGIKTGHNTAFVINSATKASIIKRNPASEEFIKPWLRGRDIKRWNIEYKDAFVLYIPWDMPIKLHPEILEHLQEYREELSARPEVIQGRHPWYALSRFSSEYVDEFNRPKIVYPDISIRPQFALDLQKTFIGNTLYCIPDQGEYLLGILNSHVIEFFYAQMSPQIQNGYFRFIAQYMRNIPIPRAEPQDQIAVEQLVRQLLDTNTSRALRVQLEDKLNQKIYELYDLTTAEIALIEKGLVKVKDKDFSKALDLLASSELE